MVDISYFCLPAIKSPFFQQIPLRELLQLSVHIMRSGDHWPHPSPLEVGLGIAWPVRIFLYLCGLVQRQTHDPTWANQSRPFSVSQKTCSLLSSSFKRITYQPGSAGSHLTTMQRGCSRRKLTQKKAEGWERVLKASP